MDLLATAIFQSGLELPMVEVPIEANPEHVVISEEEINTILAGSECIMEFSIPELIDGSLTSEDPPTPEEAPLEHVDHAILHLDDGEVRIPIPLAQPAQEALHQNPINMEPIHGENLQHIDQMPIEASQLEEREEVAAPVPMQEPRQEDLPRNPVLRIEPLAEDQLLGALAQGRHCRFPNCNYSSSSRPNLTRHVRGRHLGGLWVTCDVCGARYKRYNRYRHRCH